MNKIKVYNTKEIQELSKTYDLKLPITTTKQLTKRVIKKINKKQKKSRIQKIADKLNKHLPRSEKWFQSMWPYNDRYNCPLGCRIPDVVNKYYKYVIEIDGSVHRNPKQQQVDNYKNHYYKESGYKVFRIEAFNIQSYNIVLNAITELRMFIDF